MTPRCHISQTLIAACWQTSTLMQYDTKYEVCIDSVNEVSLRSEMNVKKCLESFACSKNTRAVCDIGVQAWMKSIDHPQTHNTSADVILGVKLRRSSHTTNRGTT